MWRPDNWIKNPLFVLKSKPQEAYEAGADAMLEALCTEENRMDSIDQWGNESAQRVQGWLVFIPEEEEEAEEKKFWPQESSY